VGAAKDSNLNEMCLKMAITCHHFNLRHMRYEKCGVVGKLENCIHTITEVIYSAIRKSSSRWPASKTGIVEDNFQVTV